MIPRVRVAPEARHPHLAASYHDGTDLGVKAAIFRSAFRRFADREFHERPLAGGHRLLLRGCFRDTATWYPTSAGIASRIMHQGPERVRVNLWVRMHHGHHGVAIDHHASVVSGWSSRMGRSMASGPIQ